jgi:hypothetical protein
MQQTELDDEPPPVVVPPDDEPPPEVVPPEVLPPVPLSLESLEQPERAAATTNKVPVTTMSFMKYQPF